MAHQTAPPLLHRFVVLGAVLALHLALIMLVLATSARRVPAPLEPAMSAVMSLAADQAAPPPALPSKVAKTERLLTEPIAEIVDPASTAAATGGCATVEWVAKGMLADPLALDAVLNAPPETRSIADAMVIWNAGWSEAASSFDSSLGAVRVATERSLRALDDKCLDEPVAGPRIIPVPAGARTMLVVFGSGNWRWRDLIAEQQGAAGALDEHSLNQIIAPSPRN